MAPSEEQWAFEIESGDHIAPLRAAAREGKAVVISYRSAEDPLPHDFLLFPRHVYRRNGHGYVVGWSAHRPTRFKLLRVPPRFRHSGMIRSFRLDRILAVTARPLPDWSLRGYFRHHLLQRGVVEALRIFVIDAIVLLALVAALLTVMTRFTGTETGKPDRENFTVAFPDR